MIQYNEYYQFGLQASSSWTRENSSNNFLYNAGNELNPSSGWYEMFYRGYDPALGRMLQVDPYATSFASQTPYNYALNNPGVLNDPSGGYTALANNIGRELVDRAFANGWAIDFQSANGSPSGGSSTDRMSQKRFRESEMRRRAQSGDPTALQEYTNTFGGRYLTITTPGGISGILKYGLERDYNGQSGYWEDYGIELGIGTRFVPFAQQGYIGEKAPNSWYTVRSFGTDAKNLGAEFLTGEGPERSLFTGGHPLVEDMRNSYVVMKAILHYQKNYAPRGLPMVRHNVKLSESEAVFLRTDIEQFLGSARVSIVPTATGTIIWVDNTTDTHSGTYDMLSPRPRDPNTTTPFGTIFQRFIWKE